MDISAYTAKLKNHLSVALVVSLITVSAIAYYLYAQLSELKKNPQAEAKREVEALVSRVGKLIVLPEGEEPTMATVVDPARLGDQPFFARAVKGDKVLIYSNAKKAILYNPESNKIVEVAPITLGNPLGTLPTTPKP